MDIDSTFYPVFCGTSLRFSNTQDEIETTSIASGSDREFIPGMSSYILEISGVTTLDNSDSRIAITYLMQQAQRRQLQSWKIVLTDDDGDIINYTFQGFIRDTDFDKSIPGYSKSNVVVRVSGAVTIDAVAPPPSGDYEVYADYWSAVGGNDYISGASTGNTDGTAYTLTATDIILAVTVENQHMYEVTGAPTDGNPEYQFVTSPGVKVQFPSSLVFGGGEKVFVMFKRPI
jgi:hypothetical protein